MPRRRHVVRLAIPGLLVLGLAVAALWRIGQPITDPQQAIATSGNLEREASLERIEVRQVVGRTAFWAGSIDQKPVFVVLGPETRLARGVTIRPGRRVTVVGEVRALPSPADMARQWFLDAATVRQVEEVGSYVYAFEIR